jgi:hypothetical protein
MPALLLCGRRAFALSYSGLIWQEAGMIGRPPAPVAALPESGAGRPGDIPFRTVSTSSEKRAI